MGNNKRLYEFDSLRGVAAISVCLFHFSLFRFGCIGVDLFFLISGFVIFMSIVNAKDTNAFWQSRFVRLYPSYWLSIIIAIICSIVFEKEFLSINFKDCIGNLTMFQPIFRAKYISSVYWTLYVEMLFYIIITIIWIFNQLKNIEFLIFIGLVIIITINGAYLYMGSQSPEFTRYYIILRSLVPLLSHLQFFSAGIIFFIIYNEGVNSKRLSLLILTIVATTIAHKNSVMINSYLSIAEHLIGDIVIYLIFFLIIQGKLKFFRLKILLWFGSISYPLYLIHDSFGVAIKNYLTPTSGVFFSILIGLSATFLMSHLITYYYDVPIRKRLKKNPSIYIKINSDI